LISLGPVRFSRSDLCRWIGQTVIWLRTILECNILTS